MLAVFDKKIPETKLISFKVDENYYKPGFFRELEIFAYFAVFRKIAKISSRENLPPRKFNLREKITDQDNFKNKKKYTFYFCF